MIVTRKHLHRRTFLRGLGTAVALPFLDAMAPAFDDVKSLKSKAPLRMAFKYIPNGAVMANWTPKGEGAGFEFSRILKPIEPFRDRVLVLTGLNQNNAASQGEGGGQHSRAASGFLTGVHIKKSATELHGGISADQVAARAIGGETKFRSLELGCDDTRTIGNCDNGYSCAYTNSISWRSPESPMPPENNPRQVFERLFGTDDFSISAAARARRNADRKSILDMVQEDTRKISGKLGAPDRRKMDEYLYAIREVEKRIENAERQPGVIPTLEKPSGIPLAFSEYAKMMYDLEFLAFQADLTRVSSFMYGREVSVRMYDEIGMTEGHHPLSHHANDPVKLEALTKINTFHMELFAYFLDKLKATPEGDGTLLDHVMVVYGAGISDSNRHTHDNLPILVAGGGAGALKGGRHVAYDKETPLANLYVTLLHHAGVHEESLGISTGELGHLTEL